MEGGVCHLAPIRILRIPTVYLSYCGPRSTEQSNFHSSLSCILYAMRSCQQCRDAKRKCIPGNGTDCVPSCNRCLRNHLACSHLQTKIVKRRTLEARQPLARSPTELQTRSCRVDNFLSDDGSVAVLVHEYLSKIHGRPHSIFHAATLWEDIRNQRAGKALILAICAMGAHVSTQPTLRSLEPLLTAESKRLLKIDLERVCLENIQTCILVANLCVAHANPSSEFLFFRKFSFLFFRHNSYM